MEYPQYRASPSPARMLVPNVFLLLFLGALFYAGIYVNFYLLQKSIPLYLNVLFIAAIVLLLVLQLVLSYLKYSKYIYDFYPDRIEMRMGKRNLTLLYNQVDYVNFRQDFFDRIMNTGNIILGDEKQKLEHVPNSNQIYFYAQKLVQMNRNLQYQ